MGTIPLTGLVAGMGTTSFHFLILSQFLRFGLRGEGAGVVAAAKRVGGFERAGLVPCLQGIVAPHEQASQSDEHHQYKVTDHLLALPRTLHSRIFYRENALCEAYGSRNIIGRKAGCRSISIAGPRSSQV